MDSTTNVQQLRDWVESFVAERQWHKFHSPKNLSMSLAIESAELMEHFQWIEVDESRQIVGDASKLQAVGEELADVLCYVLAMANTLDLDLSQAVRDKLAKNAAKYPANDYRGRWKV